MRGEKKGGCCVAEGKPETIMNSEAWNEERSLKEQIDEIFGEEIESIARRMECSMCGDVGFSEQLLRCSHCHERLEHKYCSTSFRELGSDDAEWVCDWCWPSQKIKLMKSERQESQRNGKRSCSPTGMTRNHNGLDLLLEVAWATNDKFDLSPPVVTKGAAKETKETSGSSGSGSKRRHSPGLDRWSVTQKRGCSVKQDNIWTRTGIQLERANSAKGLGRRYRLLSSMLC